MTKDDIIRMAREVDPVTAVHLDRKTPQIMEHETFVWFLVRFAALVAAAEREACAKVCDERKHYWQRDDIRRHEDEHCATAIRARGNT